MSISKERIDSTKDWLDSWAQSGALPGLMLGIYDENNEELFFHAASSPNVHPATRETPLPYTRDAIFRIYSMTKPVTSVAVMILHERGLLSIYDEVSKYLPEFTNIQVISGGDSHENYTTEPLQTPLTIFHLLTHTSGITYGIFGNEVADQVLLKFLGPDAATFMSFTPSAEFSKRAGAAPLAFQPGTKFQYGFSSDLLGVIIEVVSGKSLEEFFQLEIFQPLGMVDSTFFLPIEKQSRVVEVYDVAPGQTCKQNVEMEQVGFSPNKVFQSGGAGLFSTIQDYSKFGNFLLNYGKIRSSSVSENEKRLLKEETVKLMTRNHLPDNSDILEISYDKLLHALIGTSGYGFGLGFSVLQDPSKVGGSSPEMIGTFGWTGMAGTIFNVDPVKRVVVLFFTQLVRSNETYPIKQQVRWFTRHLLK